MDYENKPEGYYNNIRHEMLKYIPNTATKLMDVGCGDGSFGKVLKERGYEQVWGIEYTDKEAKKAKNVLDRVFSGPCEEYIPELPESYFDVIFFNDVLEHLVDPYTVLRDIRSKLSSNGVIISSIPNVRYHNTFMKVLFNKDWKYEDYGVMDRTHLRFFTSKSILRMYREAGYDVQLHEGINRSKSVRPYLYNVPVLFSHLDIRYPQYATVAASSKKS